MNLKSWLEKTNTEALRSIIDHIQDKEVSDAMKTTAVHFFLDELDVEGEFSIPEDKVKDLSRDLFAEICLEVLVREGRLKRTQEPHIIRPSKNIDDSVLLGIKELGGN